MITGKRARSTLEMLESYERPCAPVDDVLLREIAVELVNIPSPTGHERALSHGQEAEHQGLDGEQGSD